MKNLILLICLCLVGISATAQAPAAPIPITRDSALRIRTGQEALGIPLTDVIVSGTVYVIDRKSSYKRIWNPEKGMSDNVIKQLLKQCEPHDRLVFSDFVVLRDGKEVKIDKKTFVFK